MGGKRITTLLSWIFLPGTWLFSVFDGKREMSSWIFCAAKDFDECRKSQVIFLAALSPLFAVSSWVMPEDYRLARVPNVKGSCVQDDVTFSCALEY